MEDDAAVPSEAEASESESEGAPPAAPPKKPCGGETAAESGVRRRLAALQDARAFHSEVTRRDEVKAQIAAAASKLLLAPESHLAELRLLLELASDADTHVRIKPGGKLNPGKQFAKFHKTRRSRASRCSPSWPSSATCCPATASAS